MNGLKPIHFFATLLGFVAAAFAPSHAETPAVATEISSSGKPRIIVTSDGEIDDQCSMIRFMLYTNECDVEGLISSSSQYHAHGHRWAGDDWIDPDLAAYEKVYPNLVKHDPAYPTPAYLRERTLLGNVKSEGDMAEPTAGSNLIVKVLLDKTDTRPVWLQAWGGTNTIARALKTIEEDHPARMSEAAKKCRFFFIWEQDKTYQEYIRPVWGKYEIPTIISDQFEAIAYRWKQAQPKELHKYFEGAWMKENILENHGPLCSIYAAHANGDFRSEGDSPAFLHTIVTGLRNMESPDWGGWGGRYVRVRENTWLDPVPVKGYIYPAGRWYGSNGWGRNSLRSNSTSTPEQRREYFKPMWRWTAALQNDFAVRADWCVKSYDEANHPPVVKLGHALNLKAKPGEIVKLSAVGTSDPDRDQLNYLWWQYEEADTYSGIVEIANAKKNAASFVVPSDAKHANTIHVICEVTDAGTPPITRYQRVVVEVDDPVSALPPSKKPRIIVTSDGEIDDTGPSTTFKRLSPISSWLSSYTSNRTVPAAEKKFYEADWMKANILNNHGPLCSLYAAHDGTKKGYQAGDFRSECDTPSFLHNIPNGLRSKESPAWGGWGGRYVQVRDNTWLDPVAEPGYQYPDGRWFTKSAWGRKRLRKNIPNDKELIAYLKPIWRWTEALQNDFASRADWCVESYDNANHPTEVVLAQSTTHRPKQIQIP